MKNEKRKISALLSKLLKAEVEYFPPPRSSLTATRKQGVYIIYSPSGKVLHVGRTPSGKNGIRQRLSNHLHGASSFTIHHLNKKGSRLRHGYYYRALPVANARHRALLEALGVGQLCPVHIGLSEKLLTL
jgi:hypothetical protein